MARHSSDDNDASNTSNYRVIESSHNGETWRDFHEVYYTDGVPHSCTEHPVGIAWLVADGEADGNVMIARPQEALVKPVLTPADFPRPEVDDAAERGRDAARRLAGPRGSQPGIETALRRRKSPE